MEAMDQQRYTIEAFMIRTYQDYVKKLEAKADESIWWKCAGIISLPFRFLANVLFLFLLQPLLICMRLAVTHADRVVFVLASSILSFYQVPRKAFYIYMAVLTVTGFLQFLRYDSRIRLIFLEFLSGISCGRSNMLLRKFTTLHFRNPFNRCLTKSNVIYVPTGLEILYSDAIEIFDFPVSEHLNFDKTVGNCRIRIKTVDNISGSSTIRYLHVEAPWGSNRFTVHMENDNLGRLISYFNRVMETNCKELICTRATFQYRPLSILEAVKHFNSGLQLVKLEDSDYYVIN